MLFWALLSGVNHERNFPWLLGLLLACGASLAWGLRSREFPFVAYAAIYGYIGVSVILVRDMTGDTTVLGYFIVTGIAMLVTLVAVARRFGNSHESLLRVQRRVAPRPRSPP